MLQLIKHNLSLNGCLSVRLLGSQVVNELSGCLVTKSCGAIDFFAFSCLFGGIVRSVGYLSRPLLQAYCPWTFS